MKESTLSFSDGFLGPTANGKTTGKQMAFDWYRAANIIRETLKDHPDLKAEAGLEGDWNYTGDIIFIDGKPTNDKYTYLCSNWAAPTLILSWDGMEQKEIVCKTPETERLTSDTEWDEISLKILGIPLKEE